MVKRGVDSAHSGDTPKMFEGGANDLKFHDFGALFSTLKFCHSNLAVVSNTLVCAIKFERHFFSLEMDFIIVHFK